MTDKTIYAYIIKAVALLELLIGFSTLITIAVFQYLDIVTKPPNVLIFVTTASVVSVLLGIGLIRHSASSAAILVFFSGYIILTKALMAAGLLHFNGEILTSISSDAKNFISILYHGLIMLVLTRRPVKDMLR